MTRDLNVVFVAPFFQETTIRLLSAVAGLPAVRLGLVSQDAASKLPESVRARLAVHERITRGLAVEDIGAGVRALASRMGGRVHRLLGALEELQVPLGEIRDEMGIEGMGAEAAANFRDKARMKSVLQGAGLPCARHRLTATPGAARDFAASIGFPLVAKPPAGSGARSTFRVEAEDQLDSLLASMPPSSERPVFLEEYVTGDEYSFDSVSLGGKVIWSSISHYAPTPLEVLREPWIQWCVMIPREVDRPDYSAIKDAAPRALATLGLRNGLSHMEWFRRADGTVAISEVGARPPGAQFTKLISYAHDFDLYAAWARLMVFDEFQPRSRPFAAGAAYLRGQGSGTVQAVDGVGDTFRDLGEMVVEHKIPRLGQPPTGSYEGEGYVIVRHPSTAAVEEALQRIVGRVRVLLG